MPIRRMMAMVMIIYSDASMSRMPVGRNAATRRPQSRCQSMHQLQKADVKLSRCQRRETQCSRQGCA